MTVKILYLILSCKYFLRIPTKTTFISTESWKSHQIIRGHVVFLFSFDTYDVVRSWSIFLLPSIVLVNLFGKNYHSFFSRSPFNYPNKIPLKDVCPHPSSFIIPRFSKHIDNYLRGKSLDTD